MTDNKKLNSIIQKAIDNVFLSTEESLYFYKKASTSVLMQVASIIRKQKNPNNIVTWLIDRNVNYSNICISGCKFCNFYRGKNHSEAYITSLSEYKEKIDQLIALGGDQLLLQGGLHPDLGIDFYENLFKTLKSEYPKLKLHALGPPEIIHISKISNLSIKETLERLINAGLDSLPGAGAEILCDRVRKIISPKKASTQQWLEVMRQAHILNLTTSATMVFGHIETDEEIIEHILKIRDLQSSKPKDSVGFISFISWPFQSTGTFLEKHFEIKPKITPEEYIRTIAISRILLPNINNIQASWLTVGVETAQLCLYAGANDFGSIMIEENVVSAAGANYKLNETGIKKAIIDAGFVPKRRNQQFEIIED